MYSQGSSIPAKLSVSLSLNALSHAKLQSAEYFVVHDSEKVSCISMQGSSVISSKEINFEAANEDNRHFIQIAKLVLLHSKVFLVVASSKTVKVYVESHGFQEVFTFNLDSENKLGQIVHSVHSVSTSVFALATESKVHFFAAGRGASIKVKDNVHHEFKSKTSSVIQIFFSNGNGMCAVVEGLPSSGNSLLTVSKFEESKGIFAETKQIVVHLNSKATGLQLYNGLVVLVTISGQIQLISPTSGLLLCEIQAHVRCIAAFDIAPKSGLLATASEDSNLRVFKIKTENDQCQVNLVTSFCIANEMICGVKFVNATGSKVALVTYESSHIKVFEQL